ncbi:LysR family transcriptional regulator [Pantoea sp. SGAir0180]
MKPDLNLLITLNVLLQENSVSRAAERLNLSQPSVSARLERLRTLFNDPLLIPVSHGMRPTARAERLRPSLEELVARIDEVVAEPGPFVPAEADITWRIAATDYGAQTALVPLMNTLRQEAPGTRLAILEMKPALIAQQLEKGTVDLVLHLREGVPEGLHVRPLFQERYVVAGRQGHPALHSAITAEALCALEHVVVSPDGGGFRGVTDSVLEARGLSRKVVLSVPHFLLMGTVLSTSDLVALMPERVAAMMPGLMTVLPPMAIPGFELVMLWHARSHRDLGHRWLRERVVGRFQDGRWNGEVMQ